MPVNFPISPTAAPYRPSFDIQAVIAGNARLTDDQALELYEHASLPELGRWAFAVVQRLHPEDFRTYVIDRNINYTNICTAPLHLLRIQTQRQIRPGCLHPRLPRNLSQN